MSEYSNEKPAIPYEMRETLLRSLGATPETCGFVRGRTYVALNGDGKIRTLISGDPIGEVLNPLNHVNVYSLGKDQYGKPVLTETGKERILIGPIEKGGVEKSLEIFHVPDRSKLAALIKT